MQRVARMGTKNCECCGNSYDKAFELKIGGTTHIFDSFQCAIQIRNLEMNMSNANVRVKGPPLVRNPLGHRAAPGRRN